MRALTSGSAQLHAKSSAKRGSGHLWLIQVLTAVPGFWGVKQPWLLCPIWVLCQAQGGRSALPCCRERTQHC